MAVSRNRMMQMMLAVMVFVAPCAVEAATTKPNIILFMVDDMGWQDTSVAFYYTNGVASVTKLNQRYQTPNMQRLADQGMLFTDAYACPVCSPTRCSLMTGMNAARHRVTDWTLGINKGQGGNGEGLKVPLWATNGIQPPGTTKTGNCQPPWRKDAAGKYYQPTMSTTAADPQYSMTMPFTNAKTVAHFLKEQGYHTIHCGKAHFGSSSFNKKTDSGSPTPGADPRAMGFDVNIAGSEIGGPGSYRGEMTHKYGEADKADQQQWWIPGLDENNYYEDGVFLTDALTDMSLKAVKKHLDEKPEQPFYLYLAHYAVHVPLDNAYAWDHTRSTSETVSADTKNPNPNDGLNWSAQERNYCTLLKGMDDSLGQVLEFCKTNNIADNTLLIFMSDNGGLENQGGRMASSNAPLKAGKGSCYEGGIREPMIAMWPGKIAPGSISHEPVIIEDFYATFLDVAGLSVTNVTGLATTPAGVYAGEGERQQVIDGESFLPVLLGQRQTVRADGGERSLVWHLPNNWRSSNNDLYDFYSVVRRGQWKLVYQHSDQTLELYDLANDIGETTNVAASNSERTAALAVELSNHLRETKAQMPTSVATGARIPYPDQIGEVQAPSSILLDI